MKKARTRGTKGTRARRAGRAGLKDLLKNKITKKQLSYVKRAYDVVGRKEKAVAIIEIPDELKTKEKIIADAVMAVNKNIKAVLKKASERKGEFRVRKLKLVKGSRDTEVIHLEHGYKLKLDPRKVYFSSREGTERQRVAAQVKKGERVLVMFGGVAPYAIAIAKQQPLVEKVYSVELNQDAHKYAVLNVMINRLTNKVVPVAGDVKKVVPELVKKLGRGRNSKNLKFDRVVMPLPRGADRFLDVAFAAVKKGGIVHFYFWGPREDLYGSAVKALKLKAKKAGKKIKIINKKKMLPYAPGIWKIVLDVSVR